MRLATNEETHLPNLSQLGTKAFQLRMDIVTLSVMMGRQWAGRGGGGSERRCFCQYCAYRNAQDATLIFVSIFIAADSRLEVLLVLDRLLRRAVEQVKIKMRRHGL